jgi:LysM repeat protein
VPTTQEYTIQKGDTYSTIAPRFGVTVKALQTANPTVDPAKLQIGKKIIIPPPTVAATPTATPVVDAATGDTVYTVKSGDTLGGIAKEFQTTVKAIQSANGLADTRIKVGQKLKIPRS